MIRILHFSDIHLEDGFGGVGFGAFANKRVLGWANLALHRRPLFREAPHKVEALAAFAREQSVDFAVCTGDYTALGTDRELALARAAIEPFVSLPTGFFTVPGNHDVYVHDVREQNGFVQYFGDLLGTDLPEAAVDGPWPQVRFIGSDVVVIGVDSAKPNPDLRSSGKIPAQQLDALTDLGWRDDIRSRFAIVATHYAPRLANGNHDRPSHGLENVDAFLGACNGLRRGMIVHGHVHWRYHVRIPGFPLHLFGAGSATHRGREGIWLYEFDGAQSAAVPGAWHRDRYVLQRSEAVSLADDFA